jgi:hypothetical protein
MNQTQSWGDPVREGEVETLEGSQGMKQAVLAGVSCHEPEAQTVEQADAPASIVNPKPDGPRYAACGDAVTVNVAEWIGRRLMQAEMVT